MSPQYVLPMKGGDGEFSYAKNSSLQETILLKSKSNLIAIMEDMFSKKGDLQSSFKMADLGCSSGPNTLMVVSQVVDTIHEICRKKNWTPPEFSIFLNDLPENDFNTIFKLIPELKKEKGDKLGDCFIFGVPCSFYDRLFPTKSLHFVHSSTSLQWLSKVPDGIDNHNKGNVYLTKSSPYMVHKAYLNQFERDFSLFLRLRTQEIIPGGRMLLVLVSRSTKDQHYASCWDLLSKSLQDLVVEGLVKEDDLDSFNLPFYNPNEKEVIDIIEKDGFFKIDKIKNIEVNWDGTDDDNNLTMTNYKERGEMSAKLIRAIIEPMLITHFGGDIIVKLFAMFSKHAAEHLATENTKCINMLVSMIKN